MVVAHLDHALRPQSADDAAYVQDLALQWNIPFKTSRVNVALVAQTRGWNVEDAARRIRYQFLNRVAREEQAEIILTAHTQRDQAETVLMQLLRAEAILTGMPTQRGKIQRPWLAISRGQIEAFLTQLGQDWREDSSNADTHYTRAWLREEVMPILTARFPALEESLLRLATFGQQDQAALEAWASQITAHADLAKQPASVLRRFLQQKLKAARLHPHAGHLAQLTTAIQGRQTQHLTLPEGQEITVSAGKLHLYPRSFNPPTFDIPSHWQLRSRKDGDKVALSGGSRKLSDILTDLKIPRAERNNVPLLVSDQGVQWVGLEPIAQDIWATFARELVNPPANPVYLAMGEALALAAQAAVQLEVPVGAVVINNTGMVIGRGKNASRQLGDMTQHAELMALEKPPKCWVHHT